METYKNHSIETVLSNDYQPVYIAIIDGVYHTNYTSSDTEEECIKKAKQEVDKIIKYNNKRKHN